MTLCFATFGGFRALLFARGIDYTRHFLITTAYFLSAALIAAALFWPVLLPFVYPISLAPLVALSVFMLAQIALYLVAPIYLSRPAEYLSAHPDRYYLCIDWRRLISKSAD